MNDQPAVRVRRRPTRLAGLAVMALVVPGLVGCSDAASSGRVAGSGSESPSIGSSVAAEFTGGINFSESSAPSTGDLTGWAERFASEGAIADDDESPSAAASVLADLARQHPLSGAKSGQLVEEASAHLREGEAATAEERFDDAAASYASAERSLKAVPAALEAEVHEQVDGGGHAIGAHTSVARQAVTVVRWRDGDSLLTSAGEVRLVGIDTPEIASQCAVADRAAEFSRAAAPPGSTITLVNPASVPDTDRYGRMLRFVTLSDNTDLGLALLKAGLARPAFDLVTGFAWHPAQATYRSQPDQTWPEGCAFEPPTALGQVEDGSAAAQWVAALVAAKAAGESTKVFGVWRSAAESAKAKAVAAAKAQAAAQAKAAAAKKRAKASVAPKKTWSPPPAKKKPTTTTKKKRTTSGGGGGGLSGYTGPRCYAPGGKTWRPC